MSFKVRSPKLLRMLYPSGLIWDLPQGDEPTVYLSFDDGPCPEVTEFVLDQLAQYDARATFFCIGDNVVKHKAVYHRILAEGHAVGNHTMHHKNGYKTATEEYLKDVTEAAKHIDSNAFRPPYGMIKKAQAHMLQSANPAWKIYLWDVLSWDFDQWLSPEQCTDNVIRHARPGSLIVFHDSVKAWPRMSKALPEALKHFKSKGWKMKALPMN